MPNDEPLQRKNVILRADLWARVRNLSTLVATKAGGRVQGQVLDEIVEAGLPSVERRYAPKEKKAAAG